MYHDLEQFALEEFLKNDNEHECQLLAQNPEIESAPGTSN
jgi:hypothetical protein